MVVGRSSRCCFLFLEPIYWDWEKEKKYQNFCVFPTTHEIDRIGTLTYTLDNGWALKHVIRPQHDRLSCFSQISTTEFFVFSTQYALLNPNDE